MVPHSLIPLLRQSLVSLIPNPYSLFLVPCFPVSAVTIKDHSVQLLTNQPETVLRELFRRGLQIAELEVSGADLEDAFIALTTH